MSSIDKPIILAIDDEVNNLNIAYEILKDEYTVMAAVNAQTALQILSLQNNLPELILLDVNMPIVNGYELYKQIRFLEYAKNIPIIFVTANDKVEDEVFGLELGAADYITRPFKPKIMKARVKTHITLKRKSEELQQKISELEKSIRVFENKVTRPSVVKQLNAVKPPEDYINMFLDDHVLDFQELEDLIDAKVTMMCLSNSMKPSDMHKTAQAISRYGEILTLYPDFLTLGSGLRELAQNFNNADLNLENKKLTAALACLETLSYTLLHWRKQLFSGALSNPNAYDDSLLADIKTIINIIDPKQIEDGGDIELF